MAAGVSSAWLPVLVVVWPLACLAHASPRPMHAEHSGWPPVLVTSGHNPGMLALHVLAPAPCIQSTLCCHRCFYRKRPWP
eukprot:257576-Chlamydomonas_euryale.AAC.1